MAQHRGCQHAMAVGLAGAAPARREMNDGQMERVAAEEHALDIKDVARVTKMMFARGHAHALRGHHTEELGLIEERRLDAACIGPVGHHIVVAQMAQRTALGEVAQTSVALHLAKPQKDRRSEILAHRRNHLGETVELAPIAARGPGVGAVGKKIPVLEALGMDGVEEILHIPTAATQTSLRPCRQSEQKTERRCYEAMRKHPPRISRDRGESSSSPLRSRPRACRDRRCRPRRPCRGSRSPEGE